MNKKQEIKLNIVYPEKGGKNEKAGLEVPEDKFYIIYILFFLLGLVHFLPWSFFTTATKYWMYKFRNTTINDTDASLRTTLQAQFNSAVLITLQMSEVSFLIIGLIFGRFIRVRIRFIGILSVIFILFTILTIFTKIDTDSWQTDFFIMIMVITAGINSMNAVLTITLYTTISNFPHNYLAPYLFGGGLSRIFTAILQVISLATGLSVQNSALVYFSMGLFVIGFTLIYLILATSSNKFYLYNMMNYHAEAEERRVSFSEAIRLLKKIWSSVAMMGMFLLQANASPTALVVSENEGSGPWNDIYFVPVITFIFAALCDLVGRWISFRFTPKLNGWVWCLISFIRTITFIPLVMFSNAQPRNHLPVLLPHDYQYIIITAVSNISAGYLVSLVSYNIANLVSPGELKNAYHVQMIAAGLEMGVLSFISVVSVNLL